MLKIQYKTPTIPEVVKYFGKHKARPSAHYIEKEPFFNQWMISKEYKLDKNHTMKIAEAPVSTDLILDSLQLHIFENGKRIFQMKHGRPEQGSNDVGNIFYLLSTPNKTITRNTLRDDGKFGIMGDYENLACGFQQTKIMNKLRQMLGFESDEIPAEDISPCTRPLIYRLKDGIKT